MYNKIFTYALSEYQKESKCVYIEGKEEEKIMTKHFPTLSNKHKPNDLAGPRKISKSN